MFYGGLLLYDTPLGSDPATVLPRRARALRTAMAGQARPKTRCAAAPT